MTRLLLIGLAGALGTCTRYLVGLGARAMFGATFPFGTLIVNVVGCILIAAVTHVAISTNLISPTLRLVLTTGFMGGLTTYSSFNLETTGFLQERAVQWLRQLRGHRARVLPRGFAWLRGRPPRLRDIGRRRQTS
jgi:fluoride exporter